MKARQLSLVILVAGLTPVLKWAVAAQGPEEQRPIIARVQVDDRYSSGGTFIVDHTILTNTAWIDSVETTPLSATQETTVTATYVGRMDTATLAVTNVAPTVDAGGPYSGTAGTPVTLIVSGSDPGGGPLTYTWDLDDDGDYDDGTGDVVTYTWIVAATHTVAVQAADSGEATDTDTAQVSIDPAELSSIVLSPPASTILAGQTQPYTVEAFDVYANSRGMVTAETDFSIVEEGDGGTWVDNAYTSAHYGDWTVRAVYTGTIVVSDTAPLRVLAPDLGLAKSADRESVEAGAYLTYTLTYSNAGNRTATGVVITDTLDPNVEYVVGSASRPPTDYNGDLNWNLGPLAIGNSGHITFSVQVHRPLPNHAILTNTAWIDSVETTPLSTTQQTTVTSRPVLTITKADFPDTVEPNEILRYTIIITNSGNENATPVTVTEQYDPYVSFFSSDPSPSDPGTGNRTWVLPSLDADESETINIFVLADSVIPMGTILTNQATLESGQTAALTATETTSVSSAAEFTFYKYGLSDPVEAGALLDYVIHYDNHGDSPAFNVVVTETYDSHVTFVSAVPAPNKGDNVWNIGTLGVGTFDDIRVTVRVATPLSNGSTLTNRATIKGAGTFAKSYTETTTVSSAPDLTFIVTDTPDPVEAGAPLTYTLRYTNAGNADATGVVITATFDSNVSFSDSDATPPPDGGSGQERYWYLARLPGEGGFGDGGSGDGGFGGIVIRTNVTLPLTDSTKLNFKAQLADAEGDFLERTARTTVNSAPALSLLKSDGVSSVEAGDRLTYTLTYFNSGNENAYHVTITDTLPTCVEYIGCEGCEDPGPNPGPDDPEDVVFHISAITQTSGQVQLFVQVQDPLSAGADFITNTARMTHRSLPNPIDVVDIDRIDMKADLTIAANHTPSLFSPGRLMTYTVTYGNEGEHVDASHVMITTTLPDGTDYVADPVGDGWHSSDGQTYTYMVGALPAGSTGHKITFTVRHTDTPEISAPEYVTPFTIAEDGGAVGDADPEDNTAYVTIGVPDLTVADFTIEPLDPLPPDVPVTFTIVVKNQGTGWAWNPESHAGTFIDIFVHEIESYPFKEWGAIYTETVPIAPGAELTVTLTYDGFSEQEIHEEIEGFYVKVDNYADTLTQPWTRLWGLVPEYDEMNNVANVPYVAPLTAQFTATPTIGCVPLTVNFADQSTGNRTSWSWDFGDGATSTLQSPTHTYTAVGAYTVTLTVSGLGGTDTLTRVNYITVYDSGSIIYLPLMMRRWPPLPDTPVLNAISNPDGDGNYTVSWGAADLADTYILQEDDNSSFSSPTTRYSGSGRSWNASNKAVGTYYYRVRANNSWGSSGWSNVQSARVTSQPSGPNPGFWKGSGMEFDVTSNRAYVDDFAISIYVPGCGSYKIIYPQQASISNDRFSFTGSFYANGRFSDATHSSGQVGLDHYYIYGCGYVTGGPTPWSATWQHSSQVTSGPFKVVGAETVEPTVAAGSVYTATLVE